MGKEEAPSSNKLVDSFNKLTELRESTHAKKDEMMMDHLAKSEEIKNKKIKELEDFILDFALNKFEEKGIKTMDQIRENIDLVPECLFNNPTRIVKDESFVKEIFEALYKRTMDKIVASTQKRNF